MGSARKYSSWCVRRRAARYPGSLDSGRVAAFFDANDAEDPEYDTEDVYFELLREIGRTVELRVIVDIIAGASAGGINGTHAGTRLEP